MKMRIHYAKNSIMYIIIIGTTRPLPSNKCSVVYVIISESPETRLVPISIRAISMHKIETVKFQTGNTFPKQYWLAVNGKPKKQGKENIRDNYNLFFTCAALHLQLTLHERGDHVQKRNAVREAQACPVAPLPVDISP